MLTSPRAIRLFITLVSQIPSSSFNKFGNAPLKIPLGGYLSTRIFVSYGQLFLGEGVLEKKVTFNRETNKLKFIFHIDAGMENLKLLLKALLGL